MISSTLLRASWRDLSRRTWQLGLMVLGVALGVAVVVAIDLANSSASRAFELSTEAVVGRATHRVQGGPGGVPVDLYTQLAKRPDLGEFAPVIERFGLAPELDGRPLRLLGVDPLAEGPFRDFFAGGAVTAAGLERFYTESDTVLISGALADQAKLGLGDELVFQIGGEDVSLEILGILRPSDQGGEALPEDLLLADIATAQQLFGLPESITRIDVIAREAGAIRQLLPPGLALNPASEQAQTAAQLSDAFQLNLTALSLLALVVGMFLIYNTVMFSVVQRRQVLATMRALGVTREQVFSLILIEAGLIGLVGGFIGLGLGWLLGQGAVRLVTQTINDFYFVVSVREAPLTLASTIKGLLLGVGSSLAAAAAPGFEAASVPPINAMRRSTLERKVRRWLPLLSLGGLALAAVGAALLLFIKESLTLNLIGMFAVLLGLALLVPQLTSWLMALASRWLPALAGIIGKISARTVVRALSRTSVAIAALMVALSVTIGVGIMIDSFRATVVNWLDLTLRADLYVTAPTISGTRPTGDLSPEIARELAAVPGVDRVETFRAVTVESEFGPIQLTVVDVERQRDAQLYRFASGSADEVWRRVVEGAVIVSEPFAYRHDIPARGGEVQIQTDEGPVTFPIVGVYYDYASDRGSVLMADRVYRSYWRDPSISSLGLFLTPESDFDRVTAVVRSEVADQGLTVQANRTVRQEALRIFDRTFAITAALRLLAVIVAFIGVLSALLALQLERSRELATLQALGLTDRGLWGLTFLETGLMGATAGLLSLPTGMILALVLIYVINLRSFGWTIQFLPNPWIFIQALLVGVVAAMLAGIYPLRRLMQMQIAQALRRE
ncbi:MAG: FtsX-like permease family protein [Anaerolineales bacterium]